MNTCRLSDRDPKFSVCYGSRCWMHFRCPCKPDCEHLIAVAFTPDLDGKPAPNELGSKPWERVSGTTAEDITLAPSILLYPSAHDGHQGWHGFLRNGELQTC